MTNIQIYANFQRDTCSPVPCIAQFGILLLNCSVTGSWPGFISITITRRFVPPKSIARNFPSSGKLELYKWPKFF